MTSHDLKGAARQYGRLS